MLQSFQQIQMKGLIKTQHSFITVFETSAAWTGASLTLCVLGGHLLKPRGTRFVLSGEGLAAFRESQGKATDFPSSTDGPCRARDHRRFNAARAGNELGGRGRE